MYRSKQAKPPNLEVAVTPPNDNQQKLPPVEPEPLGRQKRTLVLCAELDFEWAEKSNWKKEVDPGATSEEKEKEEPVRCICQSQMDDDALGWVQCDGCNCWQHAFCGGYDHAREKDEQYFCELCEVKMKLKPRKSRLSIEHATAKITEITKAEERSEIDIMEIEALPKQSKRRLSSGRAVTMIAPKTSAKKMKRASTRAHTPAKQKKISVDAQNLQPQKKTEEEKDPFVATMPPPAVIEFPAKKSATKKGTKRARSIMSRIKRCASPEYKKQKVDLDG